MKNACKKGVECGKVSQKIDWFFLFFVAETFCYLTVCFLFVCLFVCLFIVVFFYFLHTGRQSVFIEMLKMVCCKNVVFQFWGENLRTNIDISEL